MNTKPLGSLAALTASVAVLICASTVALEMPPSVEIPLIVGALLLLATAGGLLGAAVRALKQPQA